MLETLLLIASQVFTVYNGRTRFMDNYSPLNFKNLLTTLFVLIYGPISEEALFRVVYKYYFGTSIQARLINSLLFGLVHSTNILFTKPSRDLIYHMLPVAYLAYYIFPYDNYLTYVAIHYYVNFSNVFFLWITTSPKQPTVKAAPVEHIEPKSIWKLIQIPQRTVEDTDTPYKDYGYQYKPSVVLKPNVVELDRVFSQKLSQSPYQNQIGFRKNRKMDRL